MIKQLEHPALSVADLDRSMKFYCDHLGFSVIRILEPRDDPKLDLITGQPGAKARIAHLKFGDNMLELFEYLEPRGRPIPADRRQCDHGWIHIGFRSDDVRADAARLRQLGVTLVSEPVEFRPGVWVVYFHGPDGELCELRQSD
jgi:catechol 2,3-dioxygenase-like lactoylglutathione lyase family enzyme